MIALALALVAAPRPAWAQSSSYPPLPTRPETSDFGDAVFVVSLLAIGGAAASYVLLVPIGFAVADIHYFAKKKPFPSGLRWAQGIYGATLIGIGGIAGHLDAPLEMYGPVVVGGAVLMTVPLLEWAGRAPKSSPRTRWAVGPTGVSLSGSF